MADTSLRYLALLQLIPRFPKSIATSEIQSRLEEKGYLINIRSIQRDLEKLSATFPLISDESSRPFKWSFDTAAPSTILPMMDMPTALTFELARAYLSPVLPPRVLGHLEPHFKEARGILKRDVSKLSAWPNKIRVITRGLSSQRPEVDAEVLEKITEALIEERQCEISYQTRKSDETEKWKISPLGLVYREPNNYLIAQVEGKDRVRQLLMHRIKSVDVTDEVFNKPVGFDLDEFIASGEMHVLHSDNPVKLKLKCDKPALTHLLESPLSVDQKVIDEESDCFTIGATVADSQDLRWWLLAQAKHLTIVEPEHLKDEIKASLQEAINRF